MTKEKSAVVTVRPAWQLAFIGVMILTWLSSFWYLLFGMFGNYMSSGTWTYQAVLILTPLVWFGISLLYVWKAHRAWLARVFNAMLLTFIGYGTYVSLSSLEEALRMRYYPPTITNMNDDSLWTAFGHEWLVAALALTVFLGALYIARWRRSADKK